jgi:formylglycine-generating enzyme required for sulfatase activity
MSTVTKHSASDVPAPFEAYSGEGPHVFVSYAHADKLVVFDAMRQLYDKGANIWYDEGIQPAGEWVEEIASAIKNSVLFLVFISPRSVDSRYVRSEVGYALSENKEILTILVEDTELPAGLALCLQQYQSITLNEDGWKEKALKAVFQRMEESGAEKPSAQTDRGEDEVDHGEILWRAWQNARAQQINRLQSRMEVPVVEAVPPEQTSEEVLDAPSTDIAVAEEKPRHPVAVKVEVAPPASEEVEAVKEEHFDHNVGQMSWIPGGEITIKVPYSDESKVVVVKHGYWMSQLLVTQEVYEAIMGNNPSFFDGMSGGHELNLPVNNITWLEAVSFCKAITILAQQHGSLPEKYEYRLPTEVEWEYACRAGTTTDYYFGDDPHELQDHAWFRGNSMKKIHPVGGKMPNPWGLFDLYGNVREWVGNSFVNTLLNDSEQDEFRISRGGAYMKPAVECRSSSRSTNSLNHRFRNLGFRPVLARVLR